MSTPASLRTPRIAAIPGDGIGTEVIPGAACVLDAALEPDGVTVDWTRLEWGCDYFLERGRMMPADGLDQLRGFDAIFLGAVGRPDVPDHESLWGLLIPIRRAFDQYVNLRPVRQFDGLPTRVALSQDQRVDMVIVRENTEGEYSEIGGRFGRGTDREFALQENVFTRTGIERVSRYAFDLAARRRQLVTSATKSNGIIHTMPFWDEVVEDIAGSYPGVTLEKRLIDALCAEIVQRPADFDVIVASNLFGDILSDLAAAVVGSLGIAASGNISPAGSAPSMFEPVHGSAPDIAGRGIANPVAAVWSGAMMLEHLGYRAASDRIMAAVGATLAQPSTRTADVGGTADTRGVVDALLAELRP
ncbi:MAG: tartrate dehydrogenase [Actinobacteria bacterium]|nr:tartrate dehydrogenase [Actinomycetota bacterium]